MSGNAFCFPCEVWAHATKGIAYFDFFKFYAAAASSNGVTWQNSLYFPCYQGIQGGERFAEDCEHRHQL
jgi:hypothetical protein